MVMVSIANYFFVRLDGCLLIHHQNLSQYGLAFGFG